jgi:hypothetical protein
VRYYHLLPLSYANFANPTSIGAKAFAWNDRNGDRLFQLVEEGSLLRLFGGPYSSLSDRVGPTQTESMQ